MATTFLTERSVAFTFSIVLVVVIWWLLSRGRKRVHAVLYGEQANPYIRNLVKGITRECKQAGSSLYITLFEDIDSNLDAYHAALAACDADLVICRIYNQATLDVARSHGKRCIVVSWDGRSDALVGHDSVARVIRPPTYVFEDDALVVVPAADFPTVDTKGAVVSVASMRGREIDTVCSLARMYDLRGLYVFGDIPGLDDENVQKALRATFGKVRVLPVTGEEQGRAAAKEYAALANAQTPFFHAF
jgi:hypothetical protein